ncbi:MAG: hypothetical protein HYX75_09365 [Acidobacteria bacterium]|nr:hypothetical protein [Acidobacteriota bacterium]
MKSALIVLSLMVLPGLVRADCGKAGEKSGEKAGCCMKGSMEAKSCSHGSEAKGAMGTGLSDENSKKLSDMLQSAKEVELTGKVYCAMCDLKTAEQCQPVLKNGEIAYLLMMGPETMKLKEVGDHGSKTMKVKAKSADLDGKTYVQVLSFEEVQERPAA